MLDRRSVLDRTVSGHGIPSRAVYFILADQRAG
jgi:hypothetical protein